MQLPKIGFWQRLLIRITQLFLLFFSAFLLSTLTEPQRVTERFAIDPSGPGLQYIQLGCGAIIVLLILWLMQTKMVVDVFNRVYEHVQKYATGYDVLMRSVRGQSQLDAAEQIKTWRSLANFVTQMAEVALEDQSKLTESKYALGEERLQRAIDQRQANYIAGGASRILHDGKDVYNDIIDSLETLAQQLPKDSDVSEQQRIQVLLTRLFRLMHLQLNYQPGEVVRKGFGENSPSFDLRQTLLSCYLERCWRFFDTDEHEDLPRQMLLPAEDADLHWQVYDLRLVLEQVPALHGYADDIWLAVDNIIFNAIDAIARIPRDQQQPYQKQGVIVPSLGLSLTQAGEANGAVEIRLRNRGPHIPAHLLDQGAIWDLRQGYDKQGSSHRGRGIGMYTIKQIIDVGYGGQVAIHNIGNRVHNFCLRIVQADQYKEFQLAISLDARAKPQISLVNLANQAQGELSLPLSSDQALQKVEFQSNASDKVQSLSADKAGVYYDPSDNLMPAWALKQEGDQLKIVTLDTSGVEVVFSLPAHKFAAVEKS